MKALVLALALFLTACASPLATATHVSNGVAASLRVTHDVMASRYRAEQIKAAEAAADKPTKREAVREVRFAWEERWVAYGLARTAWLRLVAAIKVAALYPDPELADVASLLGDLFEAQRDLEAVNNPNPPGAPPRAKGETP